MALHDWLAQDLAPLNTPSRRFGRDGIRKESGSPMTSSANAQTSWARAWPRPPAASAWDRVRIWAAGQRWTSDMRAENERAVKEVVHARKRLAEYARRTLGMPAVDVFAQVEVSDINSLAPRQDCDRGEAQAM